MSLRTVALAGVALAGTVLSGCLSSDQKQAVQNIQDDRQCLSYGAVRGSDAYVACRSQLTSARIAAAAAEEAAGTIALSNVRPPPAPFGR